MTGWREMLRLQSGVTPSHALAFAALVIPLLVVYVPLGTVPAFVVTALLVFGLHWRCHGRLPPWALSFGQTLCLISVLAWALVSALFWNADTRQALGTWSGLAALALIAPLLLGGAREVDEPGRHLVRLGLAVGVTAAMGVTFLLTFLPMLDPAYAPAHDMFRRVLSRGININVLLLGPALIALVRLRKWRWAAGLSLLAAIVVAGAHPLSAKLALAVIAALFLCAWPWPRMAATVTTGCVLVLMLSFPLLSLLPPPQATSDMWPRLPNSAHHRLTIWKFTADRVLEHPVRGWGLDASRNIPDAEQHVSVWRNAAPPAAGEERYLVEEQLLPLHPHNGPGQVWLELGLVGVILLSGLLLATVRRLSAMGLPADGAMALSVLAGALTIACVSFGLWQSWWQASLWLTAIFTSAIMAGAAAKTAD